LYAGILLLLLLALDEGQPRKKRREAKSVKREAERQGKNVAGILGRIIFKVNHTNLDEK